MDNMSQYLGVDLGAESGRVMLGQIKDQQLHLNQVYRFANGPVQAADGSLHWDFPHLMQEIKKGISLAVKQSKTKISGIGVDSWGVDFGLIDEK